MSKREKLPRTVNKWMSVGSCFTKLTAVKCRINIAFTRVVYEDAELFQGKIKKKKKTGLLLSLFGLLLLPAEED